MKISRRSSLIWKLFATLDRKSSNSFYKKWFTGCPWTRQADWWNGPRSHVLIIAFKALENTFVRRLNFWIVLFNISFLVVNTDFKTNRIGTEIYWVLSCRIFTLDSQFYHQLTCEWSFPRKAHNFFWFTGDSRFSTVHRSTFRFLIYFYSIWRSNGREEQLSINLSTYLDEVPMF